MNASTPLRVAVAGASGRMGRMLIEAIAQSPDCQLAGALDIASSPSIGSDASAFTGHNSGVLITADLAQGLKNAQVLIDFTRPEGTMAHVAVCRQMGVQMVIGTTGFSGAKSRDASCQPRHRHRLLPQHERGRQRHLEAAGDGGQGAVLGL
jgi:4-hydroxy-tetrahydrodipicolinate reductase